jgi:aspartate/tyrosine/aromatic aminotransferase
MYSSPPIHGAAIVVKVLSDPQLYGLWRQELAAMSHRILDMRTALKQALLEVCGKVMLKVWLLRNCAAPCCAAAGGLVCLP